MNLEISAFIEVETEVYFSAPIKAITFNEVIKQWFETSNLSISNGSNFTRQELGYFYTKLLSMEVKIRDFRLYQNLVTFIRTCIRDNYHVTIIEDYETEGERAYGCKEQFGEGCLQESSAV